jgi:D-alanine-D-alanine ligase
MKRRCCILYNEPATDAGPDELDILDQVGIVEQQLMALGIESTKLGLDDDYKNRIELINHSGYDFVFNLVESIHGKGRLNYFAPALLGSLGVPYTGCSLEALFLTSNKRLTSKILGLAGVRTPVFIQPGEINSLHYGRKYIIKPLWEDGSLGIGPDSVFTCSPGDEARLREFSPNNWIIEEYIEGREFNISLFSGPDGPVVLPPAEIEFRNYNPDRPKIMDFKAKWEEGSFEFENTVRTFPEDLGQTDMASILTGVCISCWKILGLKGYARVDIRCDSENNVFVIEVNANPCISPDSGFIAACRKGGYNLTYIFSYIVNDLNN